MLIAHVKFTISPEDHALATDILLKETKTVRAMSGCTAYTPFIVPDSVSEIGVLHEWKTAEAFEAYLASDSFASIAQALHPLMTEPPVSKRFDAILLDVTG